MTTFDVPDTIPRSKIREFLAGLGLPLDDLRDLNVGIDGVYVELYARGPDGRRYFEVTSRQVALHRIAIKLDRDA